MAIPVGRRKTCNIIRLRCKPPDFATEMNQRLRRSRCKRSAPKKKPASRETDGRASGADLATGSFSAPSICPHPRRAADGGDRVSISPKRRPVNPEKIDAWCIFPLAQCNAMRYILSMQTGRRPQIGDRQMQIEIRTKAYAQNKNYIAISEAITNAGFEYRLQLGGRYAEIGEAVTITTDAPLTALDSVKYASSAVTISA